MPASTPIPDNQVTKLELEQFFGGIRASMKPAFTSVTTFSRAQLDCFFRNAERHFTAFENARLLNDRKQATGFNVFHFIEPDENRLSDEALAKPLRVGGLF